MLRIRIHMQVKSRIRIGIKVKIQELRGILKGLCHEIELKNFDKNLQSLG